MPRLLGLVPLGLLATLAGAPSGALALERATRTLKLDDRTLEGRSLGVVNLLGSVQLRASTSGRVRVSAEVEAEAPTLAEAEELVRAVELTRSEDRSRTEVRVGFPLDRHTALRLPEPGVRGLVARWAMPVLRDPVVIGYGDRTVTLGGGRKAIGLGVHLTVEVPLGAHVAVELGAGQIEARDWRGELSLATAAAQVRVRRLYGTLEIRSESGPIDVALFQGRRLTIETGSGDVRLREVRAEQARLSAVDGSIAGGDVKAGEFVLWAGNGDVRLQGLEAARAEVRAEAGEIDLATYLHGNRSARIESVEGQVTLRVGPRTPFDLLAETESGKVKTLGLTLADAGREGAARRWRQGAGGHTVSVHAPEVTVRPYDASRFDILVGDID